MSASTSGDAGVIARDQLDEAAVVVAEPELTSDEEYLAALDGEVEFELDADGTLTRRPRTPTRGRNPAYTRGA